MNSLNNHRWTRQGTSPLVLSSLFGRHVVLRDVVRTTRAATESASAEADGFSRAASARVFL
jgi:hypothetical protein